MTEKTVLTISGYEATLEYKVAGDGTWNYLARIYTEPINYKKYVYAIDAREVQSIVTSYYGSDLVNFTFYKETNLDSYGNVTDFVVELTLSKRERLLVKVFGTGVAAEDWILDMLEYPSFILLSAK